MSLTPFDRGHYYQRSPILHRAMHYCLFVCAMWSVLTGLSQPARAPTPVDIHNLIKHFILNHSERMKLSVRGQCHLILSELLRTTAVPTI
jgi:hypothetical protein